MNVLHISEYADIGGVETNLINLLSQLDRSEFQPHVVVFSEGKFTKKLEELNIAYSVLSSAGLFSYQIWRELRQVIIDCGADLIHAHGSRASFHGIMSSRSLKIPVVRTIHHLPFRRHGWPGQHIRSFIEKQLAARAQLNIAISRGVEDYAKNLKMKNVQLISYGVDTDYFHPAVSSRISKTSLGIPSGRTVVGFMSRLNAKKDPLVLIRAFAQAQKNDRNLHLLLLGNGMLKDACLEEIIKFGIREFVTLIDYHPYPNEILKLVDIFCLPSHYETMPLSLLEAMAMKRAVITTPVGGSTEVVAHEVDGLLAPVGAVDAWAENILRMNKDAELRKELGQRARLVVDYHHNIKHSAAEVATQYRKLFLTEQTDDQPMSYGMLRQA